MRPLSYAFLTSASFAAFAIATPANAQTPDPVNPDRDPCQAPADQRDPNANCPAADTPAGEAIQQGAVATPAGEEGGVVVVGSRIRRDRFNTADPVTIINRQAAVDAGFNSTAEVLQSVGVTGGTGQINVLGDRATLTLRQAEALALAGWLQQVRVNARLLPLESQLNRDGPGTTWSGSLVVSGPPLAGN